MKKERTDILRNGAGADLPSEPDRHARQLTLRLVLPLTVISFAMISKWWYVSVVDGTDEILTGFPLPYMCRGFHTSLSLQFFVLELALDLLTYFFLWWVVVHGIDRSIARIRVPKAVSTPLITMAAIILIGQLWVMALPENMFHVKRPWGMEVMETGIRLLEDPDPRPEYRPTER